MRYPRAIDPQVQYVILDDGYGDDDETGTTSVPARKDAPRARPARFEIGAVVRLKSGGPAMTVAYVLEEYGAWSAWCEWFIGMPDRPSAAWRRYPAETLARAE